MVDTGTIKEYKFNRGVRKTLREIKKRGGINKAINDPALADEINKWVYEALERQQKLPIEVAQRYKIGFDKILKYSFNLKSVFDCFILL